MPFWTKALCHESRHKGGIECLAKANIIVISGEVTTSFSWERVASFALERPALRSSTFRSAGGGTT
jgi:hypothetical protein